MPVTIHLIGPGAASKIVESKSNGGVVSGGGYEYQFEEFLPAGAFDGSVGSWQFWKDHAVVAASEHNKIEVNYEEAQWGDASATVTIGDATEACVVNLHGMTEQLSKIQGRMCTYTIWVKSATHTDFSIFMDTEYEGVSTYMEGDSIPPAFSANATWTKYSFKRRYYFDIRTKYHVFGIKKNSGTGSILIDSVSVQCLEDTEFNSPGGESAEANLNGWSFWTGEALTGGTSATQVNIGSNPPAGSGAKCVSANLTLGSAYGFNFYASTGNLVKINRGYFVATIWAKTSVAGMEMFTHVGGGSPAADIKHDVDVPVPLTPDGAWHLYTLRGKHTVPDGKTAAFFMVGIRAFSGAGVVYMDLAGLKTEKATFESPASTYITFSSPLVYSDQKIPPGVTDLVGARLVFATGENRLIGSAITAVTATNGTSVTRIDLAEALPNLPGAGDRFNILIPIEGRYSPGSVSFLGHYTINRGLVDDISISSSIDAGFTKASITLDQRVLSSTLKTANLLDWLVVITSDYGTIWEGFVQAYSVEQSSMSLTCAGFKKKLDYVRYAGYFGTDPSFTTPYIIKDILDSQKDIQYTNYTIDRGNVLHNVQIPLGGIGPQDFTEQATTASEAIANILKLGAYGYIDPVTDAEMNEVVLQVWENRTAFLKILPDMNAFSKCNWFVESKTKTGAQNTLKMEYSTEDFGNVYYASYRGEDGESLESAALYNVRDLMAYGIREKQLTTSSLDEGEVQLALELQVKEKNKVTSTGEIAVSGSILAVGTSAPKPAYCIRGGDTMFISENLLIDMLGNSGDRDDQIITIGEVTISVFENTARITPYKRESRIETLITQLDVNTGGT